MRTAVSSLSFGATALAGWLLLAGVGALTQPAQAATEWRWAPDVPGGYASTHVIVKLREGVHPSRRGGRLTLEAESRGRSAAARAALDAQVDAFAGELVRRGATAADAALAHVPDNPTTRRLGLTRYYRVRVPKGTDTPAFAAALRALGDVVELAAVDPIGGVGEGPDDPLFPEQWALENTGQPVPTPTMTCILYPPCPVHAGTPGADIDVISAWEITTGSPDQVLAVLDTGSTAHVEFDGRMVPGWAIDGGNPGGDNCPTEHGTHVMGIAAASGNNGLGIAGVDWGTRLQSYRVYPEANGCKHGTMSMVAEAVLEAVAQGVSIMNMSLVFTVGSSTPEAVQLLHDAILTAYGADIPMVAIAGNNGKSSDPSVVYPGRFPETITVGNVDNDDQPNSHTAIGPEVDVAAPGTNIVSTTGPSLYHYMSGTSMAAPHVAGLVGLMRSVKPTLTTEQIREILHATADDVYTPGFDERTGYGRVNAHRALVASLCGIHGDDQDGDRACDLMDNCLFMENPEQRDTNANGYGNRCDADFNEDGVVDLTDIIILTLASGSVEGDPEYDPDVDMDGDGAIGQSDLDLLVPLYGEPLGPSGLACAGSTPCLVPVCTGESDRDFDGVCDADDDCLEVQNPFQRDPNQDGYGSVCDGDFDDDGVVDAFDALLFSGSFGTSEGDPGYAPDVDMDGDGVIGSADVDLFVDGLRLGVPGPSGLACAGTLPCP